MELEQQVLITDNIRETLRGYVGQRIEIRANMGRSKIVESVGTLTQIHPAIFVVEVERKRGRTSRQSFQYVDILTGVVEISQDDEPLFGEFFEEEEEKPQPIATFDAALSDFLDEEE